MKPKIIIDAMYLAHRNYSIFNKMGFENSHGGWTGTGVLFGTVRDLLNIYKKYGSTDLVIALDKPPLARIRIDSSYKGSRRNSPKDLMFNRQRDELVSFFDLMGFPVFYCDDYEADDVIATLSERFEESVIVARDADLYQLLNDKVVIYDLFEERGIDWFSEEFGITPEDWILVKAIAGCGSDEVVGVEGIGEKTAVKLIKKYGSLSNMIKSRRYGERLKEKRLDILKNLHLVTLKSDLKLSLTNKEKDGGDWALLSILFDQNKMVKTWEKHGMFLRKLMKGEK